LGVAFLRHKRKAEEALRKSAKKQGDRGTPGRTEGSCLPHNHASLAGWGGDQLPNKLHGSQQKPHARKE